MEMKIETLSSSSSSIRAQESQELQESRNKVQLLLQQQQQLQQQLQQQQSQPKIRPPVPNYKPRIQHQLQFQQKNQEKEVSNSNSITPTKATTISSQQPHLSTSVKSQPQITEAFSSSVSSLSQQQQQSLEQEFQQKLRRPPVPNYKPRIQQQNVQLQFSHLEVLLESIDCQNKAIELLVQLSEKIHEDNDAMRNENRKFRQEMQEESRKFREENNSLHQKIGSLQEESNSQARKNREESNAFHQKIDSVQEAISLLRQGQIDLHKDNLDLHNKNLELDKRIGKLEETVKENTQVLQSLHDHNVCGYFCKMADILKSDE